VKTSSGRGGPEDTIVEKETGGKKDVRVRNPPKRTILKKGGGEGRSGGRFLDIGRDKKRVLRGTNQTTK